MANESLIQRVAFGNFDVPNDIEAGTSTQITDIYIPKGAIVTGFTIFSGGAVTGAASMANLTVTPYVGAVVVGSAPILSAVVSAETPKIITACHYVNAGGYLDLDFGASAGATGITANADGYVEYHYCSDKEVAYR